MACLKSVIARDANRAERIEGGAIQAPAGHVNAKSRCEVCDKLLSDKGLCEYGIMIPQ